MTVMDLKMELCRPCGTDIWSVWRLYRRAFPKSERKPFSMIRKMTRLGKSDLWCVMVDGKFAGLAITINGPEQVLLDYFAIVPRRRGQGIGSEALGLVRRQYPGRSLFLEIESTKIASPDREARLRRKGFYLAAGLQEYHVDVVLFGVEMELMGFGTPMTFRQYRDFYRDNYSPWAAEHIGGTYESD